MCYAIHDFDHEYVSLVACLLALLLLVSHEQHTGYSPQIDRPDEPRRLLAELILRTLANYNSGERVLVEFLLPISQKAAVE